MQEALTKGQREETLGNILNVGHPLALQLLAKGDSPIEVRAVVRFLGGSAHFTQRWSGFQVTHHTLAWVSCLTNTGSPFM